jgi:shikimate dehydrogenase
MKISGVTKVCGIIGDPVEHTLSPAMQNAAFNDLKLDFIYVAFRVKKEELENAMNGVRSLGIHGLNITMPHKSAVIGYLDKIDPTAKFINAVNTVLNDDGKLLGFNTDGSGALKALKENGVDPNKKKLLLLGAGGAANAIAFHAAQEVEELVILNRTAEKAERLAEALRKKFSKQITGKSLSANHIKEELKNADILINATSVGMHPNINQSPVRPEWLRPDLCVMDIVYNPIETKLAKDAKAKGARVISGVEMLTHQGAASFEIWTSHPAPVKVMKKTVLNKLLETGANH